MGDMPVVLDFFCYTFSFHLSTILLITVYGPLKHHYRPFTKEERISMGNDCFILTPALFVFDSFFWYNEYQYIILRICCIGVIVCVHTHEAYRHLYIDISCFILLWPELVPLRQNASLQLNVLVNILNHTYVLARSA